MLSISPPLWLMILPHHFWLSFSVCLSHISLLSLLPLSVPSLSLSDSFPSLFIPVFHSFLHIYLSISIFISILLCSLFSFPPSLSLPLGLIIHEGSSVYRIFKRWQAVNQQWKVLNYEKAKDLGDPLSSSGGKGGGGRGSRAGGGGPHSSNLSDRAGRTGQRVRTILNHHCGYTILHILSQLRPTEHRLGSATNREVVMRVTTVWGSPPRSPSNRDDPCESGVSGLRGWLEVAVAKWHCSPKLNFCHADMPLYPPPTILRYQSLRYQLIN